MTTIRTGFLPAQRLSELKADNLTKNTLKTAAAQAGSEIVFRDKNNQLQTATLDQYLSNPQLSSFQGAKSAVLTLEVGNETLLLDIQELNQDNLLKAVSSALQKLETDQGKQGQVQLFKQSAAPIFASIKATTTPAAPVGLDDQTRRTLLNNPVVTTIGKATVNFLQAINPVNSPGDAVEIRLEGEAGVKIWGPLGIEASGGAGIKVSMGDDGLYYVSFDAQADIGIAAGGEKAKIKAAGGGAIAKVFRFENKEQINQFLLQQFDEKLPASLRKEFLPQLEKNTKSMVVRPITQTSLYGKVQGQVKIGKVEIAASFEHRDTTSTYVVGNQTVKSNDFTQTTQVNLKLGERVKLSGTYTHFKVDKDPWIPENTGLYNKLEGTFTLSFSKEQVEALRKGVRGDVVKYIEQAAETLALTGDARAKFIEAALEKAESSIKAAEGKKTIASDISVGIALQAQWEAPPPDGSGELQYFRVGGVVSVEKSLELDAGVARVKVTGSAKATDVTDVVVGTQDDTYLAGLFFNNPAQYAIAKAKVGGDDAIVGAFPDGKPKKLSDWEKEWKTSVGRSNVAPLVEEQISQFGEARQLYDFVVDHFKTLDADGNGYLTSAELEAAKKNSAFSSSTHQALLDKLIKSVGDLEEYADDEWGDENDGITLNDIKAFLEAAKSVTPGG